MRDGQTQIIPYGWMREPLSGLTHLFAAFGAAVAVGVAISDLASFKPLSHLIAFGVFGFTMVGVFMASALYHLAPVGEPWRDRLRRFDHMMIYLFIAGCYTPVCVLLIEPRIGWPLAITVWGVALAGAALKLFWMETSRWLRIGMYVLLSLLSLVILPDMWRLLSGWALFWLFSGCAAYGLGALVYASRWPDPFPRVFGFHEIWHIFVATGALCHFLMMRYFVV